jgi:hypothetical protein
MKDEEKRKNVWRPKERNGERRKKQDGRNEVTCTGTAPRNAPSRIYGLQIRKDLT